jgi:diguanylate cyclase (GGDEF)-like protein
VLGERMIVAAYAVFVGWVLHLGAVARGATVPVSSTAAEVAMTAVTLALALTLLRLLAVSDVDRAPIRLLAASLGMVFATQVLRIEALFPDIPRAEVSALALLGVAAGAAAVAHPRLRVLCPQRTDTPAAVRSHRLMLLLVAVVTGPVLVLVDSKIALPADTSVIAAGSGGLSVLVVLHLAHLVGTWGRIGHRVHYDELTGLPNRSLFNERLRIALAHAGRSGTPVAVMFLDLDRFKIVNDSLGHAAGNQLLQGVARRLEVERRPIDTVARLGGDEFALLLPEIADFDESAAVAEQLIEAFRDPFAVGSRSLHVSPSIGIAHFPQDGVDAERLLQNADAAMYRAKDRGRNGYRLYTPDMNADAADRLSLESELHDAISRDELVLHYQPKVELRSGQITGAEALVRWQHPRLGLLGPDRFVPLAEDSGFILELGEWVLEQACQQALAWQQMGFPDFSVAVNLSPRQFQLQRVEDVVASVLRRTELAPGLLELEVTESLAMQDPEEVTASLADLRSLGVRCSIDDFGTGYSGLSYLDRFPVSGLKIDKSFVQAIERPSGEAPIVRAVIAMAKGLLLDVVAEGVETESQLSFLRTNGCDQIQGFLFSRPVPVEEFQVLLMLERVAPPAGYGNGILPSDGRRPRLIRP